MKTIEYAKDGEPIADCQVMERAKAFLKSDVEYIKVSSAIFVSAIRLMIHERRFPHKGVQFLFMGQPIAVNRFGSLSDWPFGFCDEIDRILDRLLDKPPDEDDPI